MFRRFTRDQWRQFWFRQRMNRIMAVIQRQMMEKLKFEDMRGSMEFESEEYV